MEVDNNKLNFWNALIIVVIVVLAYFGNFFNDPEVSQKASMFGSYLITIVGMSAIIYLISVKKVQIDSIDVFFILGSIFCVGVTQRPNLIVIAILLIFMIYFNNINTRGLLTTYCITVSFFMIVLILDYYLFKDHQSTDIVMWRVDHLITRKTLGFSHPNQFMIAWMGLCIAFLFRIKHHYLINGVIILGLNAVFYSLTASRTEFLLVCVAVVAVILLKKWLDKPLLPVAKFLLAVMPLILLAVSFLIIRLSQNSILDNYLSGRPTLYKQFYDSTGISLFGSAELEDAMLDNSYLQLLLSKGLIISIMYVMIMFRFIKNNYVDLRFAILLMVFYTSGVTETLLFKFEIFLPFILYLYDQKQSMLLLTEESLAMTEQFDINLMPVGSVDEPGGYVGVAQIDLESKPTEQDSLVRSIVSNRKSKKYKFKKVNKKRVKPLILPDKINLSTQDTDRIDAEESLQQEAIVPIKPKRKHEETVLPTAIDLSTKGTKRIDAGESLRKESEITIKPKFHKPMSLPTEINLSVSNELKPVNQVIDLSNKKSEDSLIKALNAKDTDNGQDND